jgi:hypothetical protein
LNESQPSTCEPVTQSAVGVDGDLREPGRHRPWAIAAVYSATFGSWTAVPMCWLLSKCCAKAGVSDTVVDGAVVYDSRDDVPCD